MVELQATRWERREGQPEGYTRWRVAALDNRGRLVFPPITFIQSAAQDALGSDDVLIDDREDNYLILLIRIGTQRRKRDKLIAAISEETTELV